MNQSKKIKSILVDEVKKIGRLQKLVDRSLKKCPEGHLVVSKSNGVVQFFHKTSSDQKKGKYIAKKDEKFIAALAQKEYDLAFKKELDKQEKHLNNMLKNLPEKELEDLYDHMTEGKKPFVKPYLLSDEAYVKAWLDEPYQGMVYKEEFQKFETERGEKVRSKSEKIIADKLLKMKIPYRYEYPVQVEGWKAVYPDFMILKVSERKEIFLEHFGMMDDPKYCERAMQKMQDLSRCGIVLGKNLYAMFETEQHPLDVKMLEKVLVELY